MQELMEVRLKDEIIHVNSDWMESNVSGDYLYEGRHAQHKLPLISISRGFVGRADILITSG